jgi:hypothetical protein
MRCSRTSALRADILAGFFSETRRYFTGLCLSQMILTLVVPHDPVQLTRHVILSAFRQLG